MINNRQLPKTLTRIYYSMQVFSILLVVLFFSFRLPFYILILGGVIYLASNLYFIPKADFQKREWAYYQIATSLKLLIAVILLLKFLS
ncbi:hypothetical protein [Enterococcus olivae]